MAEFGDVRTLPMTDIKSSLELGDESPYRLDTHGFAARKYPSVLHSPPYTRASWNDKNLLCRIYFPEVEQLVKQLTGARLVITEVGLIRDCVHTEVDGLASSEAKDDEEQEDEVVDPFPKFIGISANGGSGASPAPKVHLDYSPAGARTHLRRYHHQLASAGSDVIAAENKLLASGISESKLKHHYNGPRWAMFSVWRPLKPITRDPLALSDRRSFPNADYIPVKLKEPTGKGIRPVNPDGSDKHDSESYLAYGSDSHDWYWIWDMQPTEVHVIQLFDSDAEKGGNPGAGGVMHSSVDVDGTQNEPPRESLEVRCTAFW
jgi:hypothetical protein